MHLVAEGNQIQIQCPLAPSLHPLAPKLGLHLMQGSQKSAGVHFNF